jgi:hypothetical protein
VEKCTLSARRIAVLSTHPIQYYSPWFAHIANSVDLHVYYAHRPTPDDQAAAGFSTPFEWNLPLLDGYESTFLNNVARSPGIQRFGGCNTPDICGILRRGSFDALLMFGWNKLCFLQAWGGALSARLPVLIRLDTQLSSSRSGLKRATKLPAFRLLLPRAADYLSPGERTDAYLRHYYVPDRRIHRLPHMVDVDRFAAGARAARRTGFAAQLRKKNGAAPDDTVFLFVGKLLEKKRPLLPLEALSLLGPYAKACVWMIGNGPLDAQVDAKIAAEKLNVRRLGFINQTELPAYYAAADCLILPSNADETWGLVVNEAQACGIPAIVSQEVGCAPELIEEGITGWTLSSPDRDTLAKVMKCAMTQSDQLSSTDIAIRARASSYDQGTRLLLEAVEHIAGRRHRLNKSASVEEQGAQ